MNTAGSVVVITGAGGGIGAALARRVAAGGAEAVVVADIDGTAAAEVAVAIGGVAEQLDVADSEAVQHLIDKTIGRFGRIDIFFANAGVTAESGLAASDDIWQRAFAINVMAHVYAARAVVPHMVERKSGHFVATASAAGLLTSPGDAPYAATKHAAVGFAEWLAVTYGPQGVGISVVCPMGVATPMLLKPLESGTHSAAAVAASGQILTPERVADVVIAGVADGKFLILPHPEVGKYWARKAADPERWLAGMQRLVARGVSAASAD